MGSLWIQTLLPLLASREEPDLPIPALSISPALPTQGILPSFTNLVLSSPVLPHSVMVICCVCHLASTLLSSGNTTSFFFFLQGNYPSPIVTWVKLTVSLENQSKIMN